MSTVNKTRTKESWDGYFKITATYSVINGSYIGSIWGANISGKTLFGWLSGANFAPSSGPIYSKIDQGRTATVKYTGVLNMNGGVVSNYVVYTEFYYSE